jgi:hypothetical protein
MQLNKILGILSLFFFKTNVTKIKPFISFFENPKSLSPKQDVYPVDFPIIILRIFDNPKKGIFEKNN